MTEEFKEIKNYIMLLKKVGNISKEVELVLLPKLTRLEKQLELHNVSQQREPRVIERFFTCECKGEGLLLTNDKLEKIIYFSLFGFGVGYKPKPSLIDRIQYAWYHIKTGKKHDDCIVMNYEKAKDVSDWLDSNTR